MSDGALLTADTTGDAPVAAPPVTQVLVRSTAAAVIYRLLNVAGGVVTLPLLLSALSRQEFGTWVVMSQSVSLFALSDLGAGAAIGRFVARYRGLGDRRGRSEVLSTVLALLTTAGLLVAALTWVLAHRVPGWVGVGPADRADAVTVFLIVGFGIAAQMPLRISLGVLVGHQMYGPHDIGRIAEAVLILVGIVGLSMSGNLTLMTLAIATVASAVIAQCILLAVAWHLTRPWDLSAERVTKPMAVGLLEMGGSALVLTASAMLYSQGTVLIAGHFTGVVGAAVFGVALTVVGNLYPLITAMAIPLATMSSEWHARNDRERLRRTGLAVMRLTFATSACIAGGLVLFGEATLRWWLQKSDWTDGEFAQAGRALAIMGVALAIGLPHMGSRSTLLGVGRHWTVSLGVLTASIISFACGAAAMAAGWGVTGAAIGWSVVWVLQGTVLFPPLIARYYGEPLLHMLERAYLPGAALGAAVVAVGYGLIKWAAPATSFEYLLVSVPYVAVSLVGLLLIAPHGLKGSGGLDAASWTSSRVGARRPQSGVPRPTPRLDDDPVAGAGPGRPVTSVHFAYRTVDEPWGGANNFLRALRAQLSRDGGFVFTESIEEDCDILFMNQLGAGPGGGSRQYSLRLVRRLLGKRKLVVRAVNLYSNVFGPGLRNLTFGRLRDWKEVSLLNIADVVVFQSAYQRALCLDEGYRGAHDVVIHNGAEGTFWVPRPAHPPLEATLRLISSTASPRGQKRHDLIARLSLVGGVEVYHLGAWPDGVDSMRVKRLGMQSREQMVEALSACHYFLHTGIKDACPNVLFEAMTVGLPVIYNPGVGSSREIVQECGLPLDEEDLKTTVVEARQQLRALRTAVLAARGRFTIAHAADAYRRVLEETDRR